MAELIDTQGLQGYYAARTAFPDRPEQGIEGSESERVLDHPDVQRAFVRELADGEAEVSLVLEGITCSACSWLIERRLQGLAGVRQAEVNFTTSRARVVWRRRQLALSGILAAVRALGYRAFPSGAAQAESSMKRAQRDLLWRMAVAGLGMMQVMMYALPAYIAQDGSMSDDIARLLRWASLILTVPVMFYSCGGFFRAAWNEVRHRALGMNVPVALGIGVAFVASVIATVRGAGEVYFDSVTMFAFLLLLARYVELSVRQRAARGLECLSHALPLQARRQLPGTQTEELVPALTLRKGDVVHVRPGETIPADGVIEHGETQVDESLLSGESRPVARRPGEEVVAGAVNRISPITVRIERTGPDTRASHIERLMARAAGERAPMVQLADRVAARFVALVLLIAAGTAIAWYVIDPNQALRAFVAVLVVTCPCALSIATPTTLAVATAALFQRGVLITRAHAIEALASIRVFAFDKTGTLTQGRARLHQARSLSDLSSERCLAIAAALEAQSEHPAARLFDSYAGVLAASALRNVPGCGVEGVIEGRRYRLGSDRFVWAAGLTLPNVGATIHTRIWLADEQRVLAYFDLADALRAGVRTALDALRRRGARLLLWSGDARPVVHAIATELGIREFSAHMSPEDKLRALRVLQADGSRVAMVGDGVNDAPVLARADLSIAMGSGAVLAQAHADILLASASLDALEAGTRLARRAMKILRQNLMWAVGYNLVALPLAMAGWLTPWMAGVGMALSSLVVVLNSARLWPRTRAAAGTQAQPASLVTA